MEKELLLKAVEHNWGLIGPGHWREITWFIYNDGSYDIISEFIPGRELMDELEKNGKLKEWPMKVENKICGFMKSEAFSKLCETINCEPWRNPNRDVGWCDGVAWKIESYKNGNLDKTSGKLDYIYGHQILETLVSLLPRDRKAYELN